MARQRRRRHANPPAAGGLGMVRAARGARRPSHAGSGTWHRVWRFAGAPVTVGVCRIGYRPVGAFLIMSLNSFNTRQTLTVGHDALDYFSLPALEAAGFPAVARLPFSL